MKHPNIVLFLAEDLDFEGLNCYNAEATGYTGLIRAQNPFAAATQKPSGRLLTPTIDSLAGDGVMFDNYYCTSPICTPARYTVMTGRLPERSKEHRELFGNGPSTVWFNSAIYPEETLLPKMLKTAGYQTAVFGKWHNFPLPVRNELHRRYHSFPPEATWEDPDARKGVQEGYQYAVDYLKKNDYGWDTVDRIYYENPEPYLPASLSSHNIDWVIEGADAYLRSRCGQNEPFFAYIAVSIPHARYSGNRFREANPLSSPAGLLEQPPCVLPSRQQILERIQAAGMEENACEGLWLDEAVKAVRKAVAAIGASRDTCFIFTTDHPTAGKGSCHLGRIPLIMYWPGHLEGGRIFSQLLSETDLASTILELAGCPVPSDMCLDGNSFAGLLQPALSSWNPRESVLMENVNSRAIVKDGYKYIANRLPGRNSRESELCGRTGWLAFQIGDHDGMWWNLDRLFPAYFDKDQLYDIVEDPMEQHNLASDPKRKELLISMQKALAGELCRLPHPFGEFTRK